jgi:pyrroloquinoline quinone biosynthesis protein B
MGTKLVQVYSMPKMKNYLESNGPWNQLVTLKNIELKILSDGNQINLNDRIKITPFLVPHRDEFSETVGYKIEGPKKSIIFIPDIDKWSKWEKDIVKIVDENDYALLDGSFFQNGEIPGRDMSEIPHPFIIESLKKLESSNKKSKVYFIHLNHTNPALIKDSNAQQQIINAGFNIAEPKQIIAF